MNSHGPVTVLYKNWKQAVVQQHSCLRVKHISYGKILNKFPRDIQQKGSIPPSNHCVNRSYLFKFEGCSRKNEFS